MQEKHQQTGFQLSFSKGRFPEKSPFINQNKHLIRNKINGIHLPGLMRWWSAIYILCIAGLLYWLFSNWAYDDPFITYRYAQNLASGMGFVYNPGQLIQSTTTPLFALLLAGLSNFWSDIPRLANLVGALSIPVGAVLLWDLARGWKTPVIGWAVLLLYPTFPLLLITIGSETPLYLALCLAAFSAYAREKYTLVAIASAFAVLVRPDGILVPAILGLDYLIRSRKPVPWRAFWVFLLITVPWFIYAWIYFGSPLPVTLAAKQGQGAMAISEKFAPGLLTTAKPYLSLWHYRIETALMLIGIGTLLWKLRTDRSYLQWVIFLLWPILYFLAFSILGVSRYFWYYAPLIPGFVVLVGLGAWGLTTITFHSVKKLWARFNKLNSIPSQSSLQFSASALIVITLTLLAVFQIVNLDFFRPKNNARYLIYREVGEWLNANTKAEDWVGTLEVGIIGFFAERPMVDFAGLIHPDVAAKLSEFPTYDDAAIWTFNNLKPHYLVLQDNLFPGLEQLILNSECDVKNIFPGIRYDYPFDLKIIACAY